MLNVNGNVVLTLEVSNLLPTSNTSMAMIRLLVPEMEASKAEIVLWICHVRNKQLCVHIQKE